MAGLLPSKPDTSSAQDGDPRVIGVDSDDADDLLGALSSSTARELLTSLHDEPKTASATAKAIDTSLQNTQYHLEKLENADLIRVIDTVYSEKGREMNVYAPTDQPLVLFAGREEQTVGLKAALSRLLGGFGILGFSSLVVQQWLGDGIIPAFGQSASDGGDSGVSFTGQEAQTTPVPDAGAGAQSEDVDTALKATEEAARITADAADSAGQAAGLPPGAIFFAGGAIALCLVFGWWYLSTQRN